MWVRRKHIGCTAARTVMVCVALWGFSGSASGQTSEVLNASLVGRVATVRLDMPATKDGVDVYPDRRPAIDLGSYGRRLKENGIALRPGDRIMITKVKVKDSHIEVHLGGGGYGTFGDESSWVSTPSVSKSDREKQLEKLLKKERDPGKRKALERERSKLESERLREERLMRAIAERTRIEKEASIRAKRLQAGSRFNVRYDHYLTSRELTPESLQGVLSDYLEFASSPAPSVEALPQGTFSLRKGFLWEEIIDRLGEPSETNQRMEGNLKVISCSYEQGGEVLHLEFVEGVLIRYSVESQ